MANESKAAAYVAKGIERVLRDVERRQSVAGADSQHDPALCIEGARQFAALALQGMMSEYGMSAAQSRRAVLDALSDAVHSRRIPPAGQRERKPATRDALAHAALVGSARDVDLVEGLQHRARHGRRVACHTGCE